MTAEIRTGTIGVVAYATLYVVSERAWDREGDYPKRQYWGTPAMICPTMEGALKRQAKLTREMVTEDDDIWLDNLGEDWGDYADQVPALQGTGSAGGYDAYYDERKALIKALIPEDLDLFVTALGDYFYEIEAVPYEHDLEV